MIKYFLQASCRIYDVGIVNQEMKQSLACWLIVRSTLIAIFVSIATCVFAVPVIIASLFQKNGNIPHLAARLWAKSILFVSRVKVTLQGLHHIDPHATYIYMANHQSMFDILAVLACLPVQFRWLAKAELFDIPVLGYGMVKAGYISIDRTDRRSAHRSLHEAAEKIASGVSVVIFPEGTRSPDGKIKQFKGGGFHLAIHSKKPIVPVVISGTHNIMPRGSLCIRPGRITVSINPPIDTSSFNSRDRKALMESVRSIMIQKLEKIRAEQG